MRRSGVFERAENRPKVGDEKSGKLFDDEDGLSVFRYFCPDGHIVTFTVHSTRSLASFVQSVLSTITITRTGFESHIRTVNFLAKPPSPSHSVPASLAASAMPSPLMDPAFLTALCSAMSTTSSPSTVFCLIAIHLAMLVVVGGDRRLRNIDKLTPLGRMFLKTSESSEPPAVSSVSFLLQHWTQLKSAG